MISYMFTQIKKIISLTLITLLFITSTSKIVTANELPIIGEDLTLSDIAYSQDEINELLQQGAVKEVRFHITVFYNHE